MIDKDKQDWVSLCELDDDGEICFTKEYLNITNELGSKSRSFASHLISHWTPELQGLLDYFGPEDDEKDKYSGVDGEPMDVKEDVTDLWEYYDYGAPGLDGEWHRDILRAKLLTLKLPKRLIIDYIKAVKNNL